MPSYAILGGTGGTGSALVRQLATAPDTTLHVYARSTKKLTNAHPILAAKSSPHTIFEGPLSDIQVIADTIRGTSVVFGAIGTNSNNPYNHVAEDLAKSISAAMNLLKADPGFVPPTILFMTSSGMTRDRRVGAQFSKPLHWMLQQVGKYIYEDFRQSMLVFELEQNRWIPIIYFGAPGLMPGKSMGKVEIGNDIFAKAPLYVTYTDLAAALVLAAESGDRWIGKEISVKGAKMPPIQYGLMMSLFVTGVMATWTPALWRVGYKRRWWGGM